MRPSSYRIGSATPTLSQVEEGSYLKDCGGYTVMEWLACSTGLVSASTVRRDRSYRSALPNRPPGRRYSVQSIKKKAADPPAPVGRLSCAGPGARRWPPY